MGNGTELGRVRGLGSARAGAHHWLQQRLTALGNLVLGVWFLVSLVRTPLGDHQAAREWLASPLVAVPMILLIISVFWHVRLGLTVLVEDYVHGTAKLVTIIALNFYVVAAAAFAIFSVVRIALAISVPGAPA